MRTKAIEVFNVRIWPKADIASEPENQYLLTVSFESEADLMSPLNYNAVYAPVQIEIGHGLTEDLGT